MARDKAGFDSIFEACITCVANDVYDYDAVDNDHACVKGGCDQWVLPRVKRGAGGKVAVADQMAR